MRAIAVGDNCIDYYDHSGVWYPTGNCVDSIVVLSDLGAETAIITLLGDDAYAPAVRELLEGHNVVTSHVKQGHGPSPISHMRLGGASGKDRIHVSWDEGIMQAFCLDAEDLRFIGGYDLIHMQLYGRADAWLKDFKAMGKTVFYDYSNGWKAGAHKETEALVDYGFFSAQADTKEVRAYFTEAVGIGMKTAIATLGEYGSIAYDGRSFVSCEAVPAREVINTVGAGDSYIAGFMYGVMQGCSLAQCMQKGAETAAEIVAVFEPYKDSSRTGGSR